MVGYGPEDNHFVVELTYNYGINEYERGNDFQSITIRSREALERAKQQNWPILDGNVLEAPGGYRFVIIDEPQPKDKGKFINPAIIRDFMNVSCRSSRECDSLLIEPP